MAKLEGAITISGLPPHRGLIAKVCFYHVQAADTPAPYGGHPPAEAATDCHEVANQVNLHTESSQNVYELPFSIERPAGFYYLQVRATLFRTQSGKAFAQVEQFFIGPRPVQVAEEPEDTLTLLVSWPTHTLEDLHHYETVRPQRSRPWWRFW